LYNTFLISDGSKSSKNPTLAHILETNYEYMKIMLNTNN